MTDALRAVPAFRVLSKFILATGQEIGWEQACSFCGLTCIQCRPDALYRGQEAVIKRELITKMSSQD